MNALADGKLLFKIGGNELPFTNVNFALSFSLPNFYFHATTAYDILRSKGVPLGKMDFLGAHEDGRLTGRCRNARDCLGSLPGKAQSFFGYQ